ncbi:MAG: hypothetical protein ACR2JI_15100 [Mycobacterium sp.]
MAWSQDDDSAAEPLQYTGEEHQRYTEPEADPAESPSAARSHRATLLYGIVAGFAAAAVSGLLFTVMNNEDALPPMSTNGSQPVTNFVNSQPEIETVPIRPSSPAPLKTAAATARVVSPVAVPSRAFAAPAPELQTSSASEPDVPAATAPLTDAPAPEVRAPAPAAPASAKPEFTPPGTKPPVWVPPVTPQNVPHPVGPHTFDIPDLHLPTGTDFGVIAPATPTAPAESDSVLTLNLGAMPVVIPTLAAGGVR